MATLIVPSRRNGTKPHSKIDRLLADLPATLRRLTDEERALTAEVVGVMVAQGLRSAPGTHGRSASSTRALSPRIAESTISRVLRVDPVSV